MPTPSQLARLQALEARGPASVATGPMAGMTAAEIRQAIEGLMVAIGGDDEFWRGHEPVLTRTWSSSATG